MSRMVKIGYCAGSIVLAALFFLMLWTFRIDVGRRDNASGYVVLNGVDVQTLQDDSARMGVRLRCTFVLDGQSVSDRTLAFPVYHQDVEVKIGGEEVYHLRADAKNAFGSTPGSEWNFILIRNEDMGKTVEVYLEPVYKNSVSAIPDFYLGNKFDIYRDKILRDLPALILGIFAVGLGIGFMAYIIYNRKNTEVDKSLFMLGLFSVQVGTWKLADLDAIHILLPGNIALSYVPYFALMLIAIPFTFFLKSIHRTSDKLVWYVPCFFCLGSAAFQICMQLLHIADLRQNLWLTHISLFLLCLVGGSMIIGEIRKKGWNKRLRINVSCILLCFLGMILDLGVYYISKGTSQTVLGLLGFTTYNMVLGIYSVKDAKALMAIGMQAKKLENKAFHDQLTGMYNRTAFADFIKMDGFVPEKWIAVMFDLNDLKHCNDTLGHDCGDKYICESARIISACFSDLGSCYRMGGDEFCALIHNCSQQECNRRLERVGKLAREYNETHSDIRIGIACGYEMYDYRIDYDINDTLRRADKRMYERKFRMKGQV